MRSRLSLSPNVGVAVPAVAESFAEVDFFSITISD